jgi:hypothetical protein
VNVGSQVAPNTALGTLTGSDEYWIELAVPVHLLQWICVPSGGDEQGSAVRLSSASSGNGGLPRRGEVLRLLPDLEPEGRMARVLVSVPDPLALRPENAGATPLILGDYVSADVEGKGLPVAASLERRVVRDGQSVWVMNPDRKLEIRPVTVAFRNPGTLLITEGLEPGEQIVVSDLPAAIEGMMLRTPQDPAGGTAGGVPGEGVRGPVGEAGRGAGQGAGGGGQRP